jgi:hypothetical protein
MNGTRSVQRALSPLADINPTARIPYIDKLEIRLAERLTREEYLLLNRSCRLMIPSNGYRKYCFQYKVKLSLYQPTNEAIEFLASLKNTQLCQVEFALDFIFDDEMSRDEAAELFDQHFVQRNLRGDKRYVSNDGVYFTRYTIKRWGPNNAVLYFDRPSKVTGELYCVHFEWRISGTGNLRRAGFASAADFMKIDWREFWRKRLIFFVGNVKTFGRKYQNHRLKTKRRIEWVEIFSGGFAYNHDRIAGTIFRGLSMQEIWNLYGRLWGGVRPYLIQIDVNDLLPENIQ